MNLIELLPALKALSRSEKFSAILFLTQALAEEEEFTLTFHNDDETAKELDIVLQKETRLVRECAKLDSAYERKLADEGFVTDIDN